ncbi:MAG: hypothetical protein AABY01_00060 [Nanoarchaeota archaeon]
MMERKIAHFIGFFSFLFFLLTFASTASAIGISPAIINLDYEPNHEYTLDFLTSGADIITTYVRGDLAPYAELIDPAQGTGARSFQVILRIPADLDPPGKRTLLVGAIEEPPDGAMVGGRAAIQAPVTLYVPYPGVYLETAFNAPTVNVNEPLPFTIHITNRGRDAVAHLTQSVTVIDADTNETVAFLEATPTTLAGINTELRTALVWNTTGRHAGTYFAEALIGYDGQSLKRTADFRIGNQFVRIINFTREATARTINPFEIKIQSEWNSQFDDIYGEVTLNGTTFKTSPVSLEPWKQVSLLGYWDASQLEPGIYNAHVLIKYGATFSTLDGDVALVDRTVVESPASFGLSIRAGFAVGLLLIAIFIIIIRRRKQK